MYINSQLLIHTVSNGRYMRVVTERFNYTFLDPGESKGLTLITYIMQVLISSLLNHSVPEKARYLAECKKNLVFADFPGRYLLFAL